MENGGNFCSYKDIFGEPGKGAHSFRLGGVAVVDFVMTIFLALLTSWMTGVPWNLTTVCWLIFAIIVHHVFCVNTTGNSWLKNKL